MGSRRDPRKATMRKREREGERVCVCDKRNKERERKIVQHECRWVVHSLSASSGSTFMLSGCVRVNVLLGRTTM